jgi:hypothetical protein
MVLTSAGIFNPHGRLGMIPRKISGIRSVSSFASGVVNGYVLVIYRSRETLSSNLKILVAIENTDPLYNWELPQRRTLDRINPFGSGKEDSNIAGLFREYASIPLSKDYHGINFLNSASSSNSPNFLDSKIAMATHSIFEIISFAEKTTIGSMPDFESPEIASITARLEQQKPLGMFTVSETEYFLCYQKCGIYVYNYDPSRTSRSGTCEFLGEAKSAAAYENYLVLFNDEFVEIRELDSGKLRQIISGKDIRCLDDGTRGANAQGPLRTLKFAMTDPTDARFQIMLHMILKD